MTFGTSDWEVKYGDEFEDTQTRYHMNLVAEVMYASLPPSAGAVDRVESAIRLLEEFERFLEILKERERNSRDPRDLPVVKNPFGRVIQDLFHLDQSPWHAIFYCNARKRQITGVRIFHERDWPEDMLRP